MIKKLISFVTGGLPTEIAKQVGNHLERKTVKEIEQLKGDLAYDLEVLGVTKGDPLHTRQVMALTFHGFMWFTKVWTGSFPQDVIFTWGQSTITIGFVYVLIIAFYFPFRAIEKAKTMFSKGV